MDFFDRVKELIKQQDYSLITFLESLGINYSSYKSTKQQGNLPRADEAVKIAKALNTTVEYLVTGEEVLDEQFKQAFKDELIKTIINLK